MGIVADNESKPLIEAIKELAEYRKQDPVATAFNVGNSFYLVNEQWRRAVDGRAPESAKEIMDHYRTCEMQVEQQVFATYGIPGEVKLRERIANSVVGGISVLDLGAGIGSQLLPMLARVCSCTHADVGGVMMKYAEWRYRQRGYYVSTEPAHVAGVQLVELPYDYLTRSPFEGRQFDLVICTEVIEHVPDPEKLVEFLSKLVKPNGTLVATTSFDDGDGMVPMHLNVGRFDDESFARNVFHRFGLWSYEPYFYTKDSAR